MTALISCWYIVVIGIITVSRLQFLTELSICCHECQFILLVTQVVSSFFSVSNFYFYLIAKFKILYIISLI